MPRDAAAIRRWLDGVVVLEEFSNEDRAFVSETARWRELAAGETLHGAGVSGTGVSLLVSGAIDLVATERRATGRGDATAAQPAETGDVRDTSRPDGVLRRRMRTPGIALGWELLVPPHRFRWEAVAATDSRTLDIDLADLRERGRTDPEFAVRLARQCLWLARDELRSAHIRLVAGRYDDETDAVAAIVDDHREELPVTSPLHRVPGYVRTRPTLGDALRVLEHMAVDGDAVEQRVARLCLPQLERMRTEVMTLRRLQRVYEAVVGAPADATAERVRLGTNQAFLDIFAAVDPVLEGMELLPGEPGRIVICNHLVTHRSNVLPNGFMLTLDMHFVSSVILYATSGQAPVRVVRTSHSDEVSHRRYYERLGYIEVPSAQLSPLPEKQRILARAEFLAAASAVLASGNDLVIAPEGAVHHTRHSPGRFRPGAFDLAAGIDPEPWLVPVALANFDQRLGRARPVAVVHEPFKLTDQVDPDDREALLRWLNGPLHDNYRHWVAQAARLGAR